MAQNHNDHCFPGAENATERFCDFIVRTQFEDIPDQALAKLFNLVIDHIGVGAGGGAHSESSEHIIKGVEAFAMGSIGKSKVYGKEKTYPIQIAALLNGAFAHSFDYDDTLAIGIIHTGASVIPAALAQAEVSDAPGTLLLTALSVGYEVASRLGRALSNGGYPRGFHNTSTAGIFGAVAAISKIKGLTSAQVYNAFGLAGSKTAGSMQFLDNGSWNKRLHPGFAAHDAFLCVALAEAGVTGASHIVEGKWGFLQAHSANVNAVGLTESLGMEWIYPATALKPFPACRFTHTAIEITARLAAKSDSQKLPDRIVLGLTRAGYGIVGEPSPNKKHPKTIVDAQFSIYYQVAVAWLFGSDIGWGAYDTDKMESKQVAQLCDRIEVQIDHTLGKEFEVRMAFSGIGGVGDIEEAMVYPLGEDEHPFSHERVEKKFRGLTASIYDSDRAGRILQAVQGLPERQAKDLIDLL
ncbi:hypothetical protein CPAR01_13705 [Colletotrichum paranaense]|uniref:MmgE/PrpD family protein n=3 Tax=Colletotrichum acutatum species complex TaxID=2707335 RepID=A0AAI9Y0Z0_9PEZI|nr:uncharacterized protein CPAR01_13705 [Colletotrichum paranaense]KAK0380248.1 hypothetical protein CLIM01_02391 [Colletotrichum limetticola]KAK1467388.1 hypothetical protein CMEL01_11381 [Colletotrichum melonis]KAK1524757.1 hypothetical protein CPAR01_13705 [Colletotrichum paranaense]